MRKLDIRAVSRREKDSQRLTENYKVTKDEGKRYMGITNDFPDESMRISIKNRPFFNLLKNESERFSMFGCVQLDMLRELSALQKLNRYKYINK